MVLTIEHDTMCTAAAVIIIVDDIKVTDMETLCRRPACHVIKALTVTTAVDHHKIIGKHFSQRCGIAA